MMTLRMNDMAGGLVMVLLLINGCCQNTEKLDLMELRDPLIRKAKAKANEGNREAALMCLNQALEKRPGLAQAHLDAGLLYDEFKKDYIQAIYHYERYLALRPETEKREMIEALVRKAKMSFAVSLSDQVPGVHGKIKTLQEENARLKNDLRTVRENLAKHIMTPSGLTVETGTTPQTAAHPLAFSDDRSLSSPTGQVYQVQANETLTSVAAKMYQDPEKWRMIYDANRHTLSSPEKLRAGQILIIPK